MNAQSLVPVLTAEKLKDFGFNELCHSYYDEKGKLCTEKKKKFCNKKLDAKSCTAPYFYDVMNWLETKYYIHFEINVNFRFSPEDLVYIGTVFIPDGTPQGEKFSTAKSTAFDCINDLIKIVLEKLKLNNKL